MTGTVELVQGRAEAVYATWPAPTCIVSDGAYGVAGFPGDPDDVGALPAWYTPHLDAWSRAATPQTTLWFWNTELGWATLHPHLVAHGWAYVACHVWDKGKAHVAGNANTRTLRQLPVVTEVCVQYVRPPTFPRPDGPPRTMQAWLRAEWDRTGLPRSRANAACGVRDAATRKYLAADAAWYMPPPAVFAALAAYAQQHGDPAGRPYFAPPGGEAPYTAAAWAALRAKFRCPFGVTNVWSHPPVRGAERVKVGGRALHPAQKPLALIAPLIEWTTDPGDVVWEPFAGLATACVTARAGGRRAYGAEPNPVFYAAARARLG